MDIDDLRPLDLFDSLSDAQLGELLDAGTEARIEPGVELFHQGDHADFWWVLVDGALDLMRYVGRENVVVGKMDVPGRWAGGFRGWDEHGVYLATARGTVPGRVLKVPSTSLRACFDAWFPFGGHLFQGLYSTARSIESTARQRESLHAFGTLAAGLAHEINNPAAAATRAVDALGTACGTLLGALGRLAEDGISAEQFSALDELRDAIEPPTVSPSPLAVADLEDDLSSWLDGHGVTNDWLIAPPLAAAGVDIAWCEKAAQIVDGAALETGLEWVASTLTAAALLAELKDSTQRISDLVGAVRSYSADGPGIAAALRCDRGSRQHADGQRPEAGRRRGGAELRSRAAHDRRVRGRAQPGVDFADRQRARRDGRRWHAHLDDAPRRRFDHRPDR